MHKCIAEHAEDETIAVGMANVILEMGGRLVNITDKGGPASGITEGRFIIWSEWSAEELLDKYKTRLGEVRRDDKKLMPDNAWWAKQQHSSLDINDPFPFGKYKGSPMWSISVDYLKWLAEQEWLGKYPNVLEYIQRRHPEFVRTRRPLHPLPPLTPAPAVRSEVDKALDILDGIKPSSAFNKQNFLNELKGEDPV